MNKFMPCVILLKPGGSLSQRSDKLGPISKKLQSGLVLIADMLFVCLQLHLPLEALSPCGTSCELTRLTAKIRHYIPDTQVGMAIWHCDLTLARGISVNSPGLLMLWLSCSTPMPWKTSKAQAEL